jgi:feruloyl esterase
MPRTFSTQLTMLRFSPLFTISLSLILSTAQAIQARLDATRCAQLASAGRFENTTVLNATYIPQATTVAAQGTCNGPFPVSVSAPLCRVEFFVTTGDSSGVLAEAWLPDQWYGRFMATGNGGLGGCIDYGALNYGSSMHFAIVASNNGHDGGDGSSFFHSAGVLEDFSARSIHTIAVVGKQITDKYYSRPHGKSYYLGCSTGGRQGTYSGLHWPADFDGIIAGAPATDWNHLVGWSGMLSTYVGAPQTNSPSFISTTLWAVIRTEIFKQCDKLDSVLDGILTDPDACDFDPKPLSCSVKGGTPGTTCLTDPQLEAVRKIYSPLVDRTGQLIYPRYSPGADTTTAGIIFGNTIFPFASDWFRFVVYEDPNHNFTDFGVDDIALAEKLDPFNISTFSGDFRQFNSQGSKFLTYHGTHDQLISPTNSKRAYDLVSSTMGKGVTDDFYRFFVVPGMGHCAGGPGPHMFGQSGAAPKNDSQHNIVLAMVDWVEGGKAPNELVGTSDQGAERILCRFPMQSSWNGQKFVCED